jgi:two-component system response regulator PilR (NtrC family)
LFLRAIGGNGNVKESNSTMKAKKGRILVVDDDKELADTLVEYLSKLGYQGVPAYSGKEALTKFEQGGFQVVITDLKMREMHGMKLLEEVRRLDSRATVIIVTGYGSIESAVEAIKCGAYDFITKPFEMEVMKVIVNRAMERYSILRRLRVFRGLSWTLIISVPLWLLLGIFLALVWKALLFD